MSERLGPFELGRVSGVPAGAKFNGCRYDHSEGALVLHFYDDLPGTPREVEVTYQRVETADEAQRRQG